MKLEIVARTGELFRGEVAQVTLNAAGGEIGILPHHTPLLAVINPGVVRYTLEDGSVHEVQTSEGFVTVDSDEITVVVESGQK